MLRTLLAVAFEAAVGILVGPGVAELLVVAEFEPGRFVGIGTLTPVVELELVS